jgi:hypothetical protein
MVTCGPPILGLTTDPRMTLRAQLGTAGVEPVGPVGILLAVTVLGGELAVPCTRNPL